MSKNVERLSLLCIAGLIVSILGPVLFFCGLIFLIYNNSVGKVFVYISIVLPILALILSIIGVKNAKNEKRGVVAGVTGILISAMEILIIFIGVVGIVKFISRAKTTPPDYTIMPHSSIAEDANEELESAMSTFFSSTTTS